MRCTVQPGSKSPPFLLQDVNVCVWVAGVQFALGQAHTGREGWGGKERIVLRILNAPWFPRRAFLSCPVGVR